MLIAFSATATQKLLTRWERDKGPNPNILHCCLLQLVVQRSVIGRRWVTRCWLIFKRSPKFMETVVECFKKPRRCRLIHLGRFYQHGAVSARSARRHHSKVDINNLAAATERRKKKLIMNHNFSTHNTSRKNTSRKGVVDKNKFRIVSQPSCRLGRADDSSNLKLLAELLQYLPYSNSFLMFHMNPISCWIMPRLISPSWQHKRLEKQNWEHDEDEEASK